VRRPTAETTAAVVDDGGISMILELIPASVARRCFNRT
jgi:hypothetical protein